MKIEVGMYVRYKRGVNEYITPPERIDKVININADMLSLGTKQTIFETDIIKASHNIIDLIEVGDYVNGSKVIDVNEKGEFVIVDSKDNTIFKYQVNSIVTKEQFNAMKYEVGVKSE